MFAAGVWMLGENSAGAIGVVGRVVGTRGGSSSAMLAGRAWVMGVTSSGYSSSALTAVTEVRVSSSVTHSTPLLQLLRTLTCHMTPVS